jgi:multimeric flavodoxin WrbA
MIKIAIVYYSDSGTTEAVAKSVAEGVKSMQAEFKLMNCLQADWQFLEAADAIIFGCPTYMGSAPAAFKKFMDDSSEVWFSRKWCNKIAAGFTNSAALSGDKLSTLNQLALYAFQQGMIWVGLDIMAGKAEKEGTVPLNRIGSWIGLMTQINTNTEPSLVQSDLLTAQYFGRRIAIHTKRFIGGNL